MPSVDDAVNEADSIDGMANKVASFLAFCRQRAENGITVSEFGELLIAFLRVCVSAADSFPIPGEDRKKWVLHAVGVLFDELADGLVPIYLKPFWLLSRGAVKNLLLLAVSGAIEAMIPMIRGAK